MREPSAAQKKYLKMERKKRRTVIFMRLFLFLAFLLIWELAAELKWIDSFIFSSPSRVFLTALEMAKDGTLFLHIRVTLMETLVSFALVVISGILIAVLLWMLPTVSKILEPSLVVLNSLPKSALAPLLIVWLGGNALHWPENKEFNLYQDVAAARIIFECGAALVQLPCSGVVSEVTTTGPELDAYLKGKNRFCDYLVSTTKTEGRRCSNELAWSRVIWDITTVAWLLDERFMEDYLMPSPIPEYDGHYSVDPKRHLMRYVYHVNRDKVFSDLFTKLANFG